ncbi:branched-chain amino acid ABC transporter permease [Lachnoclostridium pacaense]|nr:branched-chain amino acid ABC transporter permease [Lachnoclostridium pacaense]MCC2876431.1 branched-chain amino acid ABC transporter permease [Lachnoclostridium pacaense]MCC3397932.1 branched-chain amino acid ABC transporter permease [Clostridiales bacterium AHG0011]MDM8298431.1 branched-chain amino acid ABC transporter permease [Enterocloster aldenensis]RHB43936.1 branched-chain amino acid ABC transporter permease [Enterocloster aldenensis]
MPMFGILIQLIVSGIAMGFIYALVGIEYTLIWNASGVLNFSHDKMITTGAYIFGGTYILGLGMDFIPGILLSLITVALLGIVVARVIFIPLRNMTMIYTIMATVMLGKIIVEAIRLLWGPVPFSVPGFLIGTVKVGDVVISIANIAIIAAAAFCVLALQLFLYKTKPGKAMRCVAQNRKAAQLMGIDVRTVMTVTVMISMMICCLIGLLVSPLLNITTTMSNMIGLKGFAAGVIGGFGYLPGAILGGLCIGIVENIASMVLPSVYKDIVAFVLLVGFLLIRPAGITGKTR